MFPAPSTLNREICHMAPSPSVRDGGPVFNHILIPIDLNHHAESDVDMVLDLVNPGKATVTLWYACQVIQGLELDEIQSFHV
jgi:hypothetical protein